MTGKRNYWDSLLVYKNIQDLLACWFRLSSLVSWRYRAHAQSFQYLHLQAGHVQCDNPKCWVAHVASGLSYSF